MLTIFINCVTLLLLFKLAKLFYKNRISSICFRKPNQTLPKLPRPDFLGEYKPDNTSSVFKNPFTEEENEKEAVLQKHVKMIENKEAMRVINGVKVCWNYRKGRCRFGHKCKYAHDSDVQINQNTVVIEGSPNLPEPSKNDIASIQDEMKAQKNVQKRKRPGLTQGLVPGKKVMKSYLKHK